MPPTRTVVVGTSGVGKSTTARRLAALHGVPHVEMDALHWEPGWREAAPEVLRDRVAAAVAGDAWVVDGNYLTVSDLVWPRATRVVWLDLPYHVVLVRVVLRTFRRGLSREVLWNGNREPLWRNLATRESIIWWAVTTFHRRRETYSRLRDTPGSPPFVHLRTAREVEAFLVAEAAGAAGREG